MFIAAYRLAYAAFIRCRATVESTKDADSHRHRMLCPNDRLK